jgi:hypothetical protein
VRLDRSAFAFTVSLTRESVRVALPGDVGSFTLTHQPADSPEDLIRDSLLLLASLLARVKRFGEAMQMTRRLIGNCRATTSPDLAFELATAAYEVGDHDSVTRLAVESLSAEAFDAAQIYLVACRV